MAAPLRSGIGVGSRQDTRAVHGTSFQKKSRGKLVSIPGTRPSVQNGQLLVSTGVTSLDYVIGGGLAVGTLLLIEEDKYDSYSRMLLKYFLAEGVVCGHSLFLGSARDPPEEILQELPAPVLDDIGCAAGDEGQAKLCDSEGEDSMKIAWRYQNFPKVQTALAASSRFGHYYDVSKTMDPEMRQASKCNTFFLPDELPLKSEAEPSTMNAGYRALLRSIQNLIHREGFDTAAPQNKSRNILRIGLHSLGSPLWGDDICCKESPSDAVSLTSFLYGFRALLRSSLCVGMVTVPSHLIQNRAIMGRVTKLCDTAIALESFRGSERETNPLYKDYHGLLHVRQTPHLNCLVCEVPDTKDLAFKLKRKQFAIERTWVTQVQDRLPLALRGDPQTPPPTPVRFCFAEKQNTSDHFWLLRAFAQGITPQMSVH
ncbi:elongator complex protein 4 isoform X1 [Scleropages formosus]|uniref:Elongator complex protein 4 n=1 Tax=Scleropages formosus TaxID=113540 RepID=A0A8C9SMX3_SCLFO|nr:elongator complex protein 4 isoform X1 [Scleropages formosus]